MKVKCIDSKKPYQDLSIGKEYIVLSIEFYDNSASALSNSLGDFVAYRLKSDDGVVIPFPAKLFEITSGNLPTCWVSYRTKHGSYSILPKTWAREYFWDSYYNDDDDAIRDFKKEEQVIYSEAN